MTAADPRRQDRRTALLEPTTLAVNPLRHPAQRTGGGARGRDRARLVFIQVGEPDVTRLCREVADGGCDVAIAEDVEMAFGSLAEDAPDLLVCPWSTWCGLPERISSVLARARLRRPLLLLLVPGCGADPEMTRIAINCALMKHDDRTSSVQPVCPGRDAAPAGSRALDARPESGPTLIRGDIRMNLTAYRVYCGTQLLPLSLTCFRLLHALIEHPGFVCSRAYLVRRTRGDRHHVSDRLIDTHIARLRRVLSAAGARDVIRTVRGVGYAFSAGGADEDHENAEGTASGATKPNWSEESPHESR